MTQFVKRLFKKWRFKLTNLLLLTQDTGFFLGPIARVIGFVMNVIYNFLTQLGIENVSLAIILLTIVIYTLLLPFTIQQQKFSKLNQIMQPEISAIRKKYEGKKDPETAQLLNAETQEVYAKYGVSPTGGCLSLFIQLPLMIGLYRVIYRLPGYVTGIKNMLGGLADALISNSSSTSILTEIAKSRHVRIIEELDRNEIIDILYNMKPADWDLLKDKLPDLVSNITTTQTHLSKVNTFLGINIASTPLETIKDVFVGGSYVLAIIAVAMVVLSFIFNYLSIHLTTQSNPNATDTTTQTMNSMNKIMPLFSAVLTLMYNVGLGLYWTAGAVYRAIQQILINRHLNKIDINEIIEANREKVEKKKLKTANLGKSNSTKITQSAKKKVKYINKEDSESNIEFEDMVDYKELNPNSIAAKARMVMDYNDGNKEN